YALKEMAQFLADSGNVDAIEALRKDFRYRPVDLCVEIIGAFLDETSRATWRFDKGGQNKGASQAHKQTALGRDAVEKLLISGLDDERQQNSSGIWMGKPISNSRVCDYAGHVLNEIEPARYGFDLAAPLPERNRRRVELKNVWRKLHPQSPFPIPSPRATPVV